MWSFSAGQDSRMYEEKIEDLPALLKTRLLGLPENAALMELVGRSTTE
jgi:hypothetical protein